MAKPMVATLPFVLLLLDYWPLGRTRWAAAVVAGPNVTATLGRLLKEKVPFFVLTAVSSVVTFAGRRTDMSLVRVPLGLRIANALLAYVGYIGKMFWPTRLAVFYPLHAGLPVAAALAAGAGLVAVTAAVVWAASRKRSRWLVTGWFWYLGMLVPVIGLVQGAGEAMADRFPYLPLIGVFIMLAWSVPDRAMERRVLKVITCLVAVAALAMCAVLSRIQVGYWKNSETLFRHALDVTRDNWLAHCNLGIALAQAGRMPEAIEHLEQSLRINPDYADAHNNLGNVLTRSGRLPEAIEHLEQALRINPDFAEAHNSLGIALAQAGRIPEAIAHLEQALRINPNFADAHNNLGITLGRAGRLPEAIEHLKHALRINPDYAEAHYNLGIALEQTGNLSEAIKHYQQALRLEPDLTPAQNALARLHARQ
jgi:Flp pilus assembly protein TadD